jgi:hypothetical protein
MERACYKCGASVEEGTPFCSRCNAPQIRVVGLEPVGTPSATMPQTAIEEYASHAATPPSALEWPQALPSAGIAVLVAILITVVSKSTWLAMLAAGFLSVVLYRRRCPTTHVTAGMGARLGALTGALGFGIVGITLALWTVFRSGKEIHDAFLTYIQQNAGPGSDPRIQQVIDLLNTADGFTFIMIFSLIMTLVVFTIFSSLGGAISAFLLHRKERL